MSETIISYFITILLILTAFVFISVTVKTAKAAERSDNRILSKIGTAFSVLNLFFDMAIIIYLAYQFFMPDKSNGILPIMVWIIGTASVMNALSYLLTGYERIRDIFIASVILLLYIFILFYLLMGSITFGDRPTFKSDI